MNAAHKRNPYLTVQIAAANFYQTTQYLLCPKNYLLYTRQIIHTECSGCTCGSYILQGRVLTFLFYPACRFYFQSIIIIVRAGQVNQHTTLPAQGAVGKIHRAISSMFLLKLL